MAAPAMSLSRALVLVALVALTAARTFKFYNNCDHPITVAYVGGSTGVSCSSTDDCVDSLNKPTSQTDCLNGTCFFVVPDFGSEPIQVPVQDYSDKYTVPTTCVKVVGNTGAGHTKNGCHSFSGVFYLGESGTYDNAPIPLSGIYNGWAPNKGPADQAVSGAELTLSPGKVDYYDTTMIGGVSVPVSIQATPKSQAIPSTNDYTCTVSGATFAQGSLQASNWTIDSTVIQKYNPNLNLNVPDYSVYVRRVFPNNLANPQQCTVSGSNSKCPANEECGVYVAISNKSGSWKTAGTPKLYVGVCGLTIGAISPNGVCALLNDAPSSATVYSSPLKDVYQCQATVPTSEGEGTRENLYGCVAPPSATPAPTPAWTTCNPTANKNCMKDVCSQTGTTDCCTWTSGTAAGGVTPQQCAANNPPGVYCQCPQTSSLRAAVREALSVPSPAPPTSISCAKTYTPPAPPPGVTGTCNPSSGCADACGGSRYVCQSNDHTKCQGLNPHTPTTSCQDAFGGGNVCECPPVAPQPGFHQTPYKIGSPKNTCGCAVEFDWYGKGSLTCQQCNDAFKTLSQPWLMPFKQAAPTSYVYPYDDSMSTFTCGTVAKPNDVSYTITACPNKVPLTVVPFSPP